MNGDDDTPRDRGPLSDAALRSLVSNLVYLGVMLGFTLAISKRDELVRLHMRLSRAWRKDAQKAAHRRIMAEFRRQLAEIEHGAQTPPAAPEDGGGLYGPR